MIRKELEQLSLPIDDIHPHPRNVRQGDIGAICQSLEAHGQYRAIAYQMSSKRILAGNHTWKAAKQLGWTHIAATPIICDDEQALRILLADNKANDLATYNDAELIELLKQLADTDLGLDSTLFDGDALDDLISKFATYDEDMTEPATVLIDEINRRCKFGEIWTLGNHRLMCGDSRDADQMASLIQDAKINIAFTSPPYADRRKYDESSAFKPIPPNEYVKWYKPVSDNTAAHLATDGSMFINIKSHGEGIDNELYVFDLVTTHAREWGWHFATEFCWERNGVPKSVSQRFKNQFEPIYQFTLDRWKMRPDNVRHYSDSVPIYGGEGVGDTSWKTMQGRRVMFGAEIKKRKNGKDGHMAGAQGTNVQPGQFISAGLAYPGNRLPTFASTHEAVGHAAAFPVGLPAFFIQAFSDNDDVVFDAFAGSGSTLLACEELDRVNLSMEVSPQYCDLICARYQKQTGDLPRLEATSETHNFLPDAD
jgi:hypothetical protein